MQRHLSIISAFIFINLGAGRLFQESIGVVCFSELAIIGITGFFFWYFSANKIAEWSVQWQVDANPRNLLIHGSLGLSAAFLNVVVAQLMVKFLMTTIYGCITPTFGFLNASLTNNIAINLLCYFSLLLYFLYANRESINNGPRNVSNNREIPQSVSVTRSGSTFILSPQEILHIEAANNCIVLHTKKGKFVKYQSLKSIQSQLPTCFKRVHRSRLVNHNYIEAIKRNKSGDGIIVLNTGQTLRFSRNYQKEFA